MVPAASQYEQVVHEVFAKSEPIEYVRVHDFQQQSLKRITFELLSEMPMYKKSPRLLRQGLRVTGELGQLGFTALMRLLACNANEGAWSVAHELALAANKASDKDVVTVEAAEGVLKVAHQLERSSVARRASKALAGFSHALVTARKGQAEASEGEETQNCLMLIYLNNNTFKDVGNVTAALVRRAMDLRLPLVLAHEQDSAKGHSPFRSIIQQTPDDLLVEYRLFDTLAVPLYKAPFLREVSFRHMLRCVGAKRLSKQHRVKQLTRGWVSAGRRVKLFSEGSRKQPAPLRLPTPKGASKAGERESERARERASERGRERGSERASERASEGEREGGREGGRECRLQPALLRSSKICLHQKAVSGSRA